MRIMTLLLFVSACSASRPRTPPSNAVPPGTRAIAACVVNDADAPVPEEIIRRSLSALSLSYYEEAGIVLDARRTILAPFKPSGWPMDVAFNLKRTCPDEDELRFVFTDRDVHRGEASMTMAEDDARMAGDSHPYYGFVIAYSARERWEARNAGGERALVGTLKHELGHVFGLEDSADKTSFMYFASNGSLGRWTEESRRTIRANKWRRWWPRG